MESVKRELCDSLIQWFQILNLQAPHKNVNELSDGVAMAQALYQIAPDTFTGIELNNIKIIMINLYLSLIYRDVAIKNKIRCWCELAFKSQ